MGDRRRDELTARVLLTLGALVPYWPLLTFGVIFITDDFFSSDIFNGELPGRVLVGQLLGAGHAPVWTSAVCSGMPLAGAPAEPIGLLAFALLPPAPALDLLLIVLLLVAAHGAYDLARRVGAGRPGAVLAGLAFAGSGYIACQLKHVAIVSTVVWLPVGLALLDRALAFTHADDIAGAPPRDPARSPPTVRRLFYIAAFGLVFAEQVLAGFPQSAYICGLVYGPYAVFRALTNHQRIGKYSLSPFLLVGVAAAIMLGAASGAVVLLPLSAAGALSDRSTSLGWQWSTMAPYWPPNALTFLLPYVNGDISDNTYRGPSLFWEDYGYVGAATVLLALYGALREWRRPTARFLVAMTTVAYLMVLGPATIAFRLAYDLVPGMDLFRFPTRFLIVVELGLAVLAALGLTRLGTDLTGWCSKRAPRLPRLIVLGLCAGTAVDLYVHQPRQNPMVPAEPWLAPPPTVDAIRADTPQARTLTPHHDALHRRTFAQAAGWSNVAPYFEMRDLLQPNIGGVYWNLPSGDCYAGLAPRWYVDVWGDHIRRGRVIPQLSRVDSRERTLFVSPRLSPVLKAFGVTHLLSRFPVQGAPLPLMTRQGGAYIYRIEGAARVRFVPAARHVGSDLDAVARLLGPDFDADREILLHDAPYTLGPRIDDLSADAMSSTEAHVAITREGTRDLEVEAVADADGFLLLADTFYPGWSAEIDGVPVQIYRANVSVRAVPLTKGRHVVRFEYEAPAFFRGLRVTILSLCALLFWMAVAAVVDWRSPRRQTAS